ncbi:Transient receptor potential cation channel subfamily A member 1 [Gryllus bimaculatus]|nr:Transient receptor potential cation channel subfamily A member 1 [Gryllus bimaculatus]
MGKKRTSKAKRKVGAIKIKKIKKLKEPDKKKDSASNFFWAVKVLKKVANKPIEVSPQNLREVLSKCPHAVATWAGKSAILNAVQLMRDDLLYVLIEAGAIIQPPGTQVCENDIPEDGDDVNSEAKALVHSVVTDASVCAFLSKCADFPHNKLNDLLREADSADAVKALLTVGAQPNYFGSYGCTAIHEAAYSGRPVCLFTLLQRGGISFTRSAEGRTALHAAAIGGNIACVKVLITAGVSMRAIDYCAMTALHFAAGSSRSAGCVPLLVAAGANVNAKDKFDMTPLHYAAAYGTAETVKLLLEEGADREALDQWHRTPGHTVYSECDTRERKEARAPIYWLLNPEGGGDEQTWDNIEEDYLWDVEPPLPTSQQCQQDVNVLRQLACFGDVTLKEIKIVLNRSPPLVFSYSACKALQTCAEMGRLEIINAFLKKGASPHIRECDFCSDEVFEPFVDPGYLTSSCNDWPLIHIAAAAGQVQTVDTLLAAKASKKRVWVPEYADPFGPLEAAAANGHLAMVKYLLYSGCVTDREQVDGALRLAVTPKGWQAGCKNWVEETQVRIARTLLDAGADPNARDLFGHSPVHGAAYCGWSKCLSLLIRRGSKVLAETQNGKTALHIAACGRHIVCISLLIKARANVSSKDCLGQTPLHYVAEGLMQSDWAQTQCSEDDGAEIVKALVDAGADVNCHDKNGVTALHLAAKSGSFAVVEALLNAGALINAKDRNSRTPLHYAADAGADRVVDKLIKSGADTNAKDHSGCIPHDHPKTNSASLERSDAERELENEDSEESERSWCGICSGDEWVEVESSGDDSDDWELECYRWVKELCKRSSDKEDREEIVESQLKQNTECKPNEAKKSEQDILLKSLREVETESEDEESDDDCALDEGEEVDEFTKAMKNREKISKLSIKLRLRGYVDSDAEFESRPDEDAKHTYLPPGAVSDPNALWYNKQWIKENEVCNDNASQKPSEVVSKSEADCQTEGKVDSRLKDSLLSETDHSRKVKREAEGKKECEKGQSNSVQDTQEAPVNQERDSQRDKRMKDEHEFTKELRIKVELDDDDDDDDDEEDDDDDDDDDDDEQDIPYVSGAWTVPQQSEKVGNEENDMWDRRDSKWRKGEGSSGTLGFRVESNAACWRAESTSSSNLLGREEEVEKGERRRGGVWLRLGKRSTDGDSDSPHNSIVVTRVLSENDERTLRYVEENSLEEWETKRKQEGKYKRQMYSQQRRFAGESKNWERCEAYEPDSPGLEEGYSRRLQNEVVSTHQLDESFSLTERWVSVCSESSERIVYVQDPRESIKTRDEQNTSGDLRNWCERPLDPTESGGCDEGSLEELQSGIRSNLFEVQESGRGRERHCSGKGYEREAFEKHGEERRLFGVKAERGHRFRGAQAKQEENDWKTKKVQNVFRPCAEEDAIEKLYGWEEQISHTSIRAQDDHKGSRQNEGLSRNCSYRSYNQGRDNSSTASYDWERQDLLDIQERKKRYGSHERVSFECGTHRDFGERCNEFERLSDETGNKSRSHERVSFEHGRQRGFRERHNEFERVSDERGNKSGSREKESSEYQTQRGFGERQNQFKRIKDDRGNKTFEYDDRLRKELPDYHTRLDAHKNEASCSTSRIYEDEVRMRRKLGVRGQDGYCYQAGSNEEEYERPHIGYRLSEPDRMRPHSQYSEQEQNVLHRYGEPVNQDRIQGQLRNAGENDPCKLLLIQEHHRSREQICEKTLSPYDRIGRQEHDWSMERARNIVGSQHSENWEKNSQDRLKEHEYRNLQSPRSRYDEQEHYRYASYRRQELEKNNQTSGRAYVVSHSQNRLEENAFGRSQSPRSRYVEQEYYRSSGYGRQESERFSQTSAHGDVVSHSQNRLEENEFGRLRSPKRRYDEQDHYRSTGYGRQESDKFSQTSARADVSHCQNRLEENAFGRSQSPKSRYYDQEYYRSASYGRQESEKNSQTMGRADNGSCSPHRSRIRFTERKYGGRREQARDPSDIHYSDKEYERFHSYYTSRKLSHRSCSPFSRFGPQERDISDTHYGRQGPKLYDDRKSGEHVYDRTRSPCRRVGDEMQGRLRKNKAGEMRHDRSRIQFSGSDERDFRTHTQRRWPDILEDVPH